MTLHVQSDTTQKIFKIENTRAAYSMTGITLLGDKRERVLETILFNFNVELDRHVARNPAYQSETLKEYATRICNPILESLRLACDLSKLIYQARARF